MVVDDAKKKKEDGDKEAPIDPENVNNPTEPMRIEEKVRKRKEKMIISYAVMGKTGPVISSFANFSKGEEEEEEEEED